MDIKTTMCRAKEQIKINSPEILLGVGIASGLVAIGAAVVATTKVEKRLDEIKDNQTAVDNIMLEDPKALTEDEASKAKVGYAIRGYSKIALDYSPVVLAYGVSVACLIKSHNVMSDRLKGAITAYMSIDAAYKAYRMRVEDKFGVDEERKIRYNVTETTSKERDPETGKLKKVKVHTIDGDVDLGPYVRFFDEASREWCKDSEHNAYVLRTSQQHWNDILKTRSLNGVGRVFLNEVLHDLDLPETEEGQYIGWSLNKGDKPHIDFGFMNYNPAARRFINGYEAVCLLDFNCDGYVANVLPSIADDKIEEKIASL